jgi:hypothetical protein
VFWVRKTENNKDKYEMIESYGLPHSCPEGRQFILDWNEAKRIDYAFEKARFKAIPDGTICKKCDGKGHTFQVIKNERILAQYGTNLPFRKAKLCRKCKSIAVFSAENKAFYLKNLRKKYWPYKQGIHKWAKYGI